MSRCYNSLKIRGMISCSWEKKTSTTLSFFLQANSSPPSSRFPTPPGKIIQKKGTLSDAGGWGWIQLLLSVNVDFYVCVCVFLCVNPAASQHSQTHWHPCVCVEQQCRGAAIWVARPAGWHMGSMGSLWASQTAWSRCWGSHGGKTTCAISCLWQVKCNQNHPPADPLCHLWRAKLVEDWDTN